MLFIGANAQKKMFYTKVKLIGESNLICYYNYVHSEREVLDSVQTVLQIGDEVQRFSSFVYYRRDSLGYILKNEYQEKDVLDRESRKINNLPEAKKDMSWVLYTNYPEGKQSITDRVFTDRFISEEDITVPDWTLEDEHKVISGYECNKATTHLHGRNWTVWYTPKIERPDGPWLLKGLPGLVVFAEDDSGGYKFTLQKIEHRKTPILFNIKDYFKSKRVDVLKNRKKYYDDMAQYVKNTEIGKQTSDLPQTPRRPFYPLRKISK